MPQEGGNETQHLPEKVSTWENGFTTLISLARFSVGLTAESF